MSIFNILYTLFIGPLELFFEILFAYTNKIVNHPGLSIICLSIVMNFLVLPLYKKADAMQAEERDTELRMKPWIDHIKKTFKGDERFMMLQTYYRQNNYKPTHALKGSVSLLLEIPFFIAAYNFLSHLQLLEGVSFGPIHDLGAPDGMLVIAGVAINVLPILMTLINIVSGMIYTKGLSLKSKIQLYGMALIFLVLLYQSPAGLVFYWTLNNIFSLIKNIFYKLKNPALVLCSMSTMISTLGLVYILLINPMQQADVQYALLKLFVFLQVPLLIYLLNKRYDFNKRVVHTKNDKILFFSSCFLIAILVGVLIPSSVIKSSPEEFINISIDGAPMIYIINAAVMAFGLFVVWFGIFYMLLNNTAKKVMGYAMWLFAGIAIVDYMFFGQNYGTLAGDLTFINFVPETMHSHLINLGAILLLILVMSLIWKKKEFSKTILIASCIAMIGMSGINIHTVHEVLSKKIAQLNRLNGDKIDIPLTKNDKNVVIMMMDRAVSKYLPYILDEKPELIKQFDGFTYYPNTLSFGGHTNFGLPGVLGGYEYTPKEMNKRKDESLVEKHNEALKVMPTIFSDAGFGVTFSDPTYAGYDWIPDLSIFDDNKNIKKFITKGRFSTKLSDKEKNKLMRDFVCYGIMKITPTIVHEDFYDEGLFNNLNPNKSYVLSDIWNGTGIDDDFIRSYDVLTHLSSITSIHDDKKPTFFMMCNETTHEPMLLQQPDYTPEPVVKNEAYDYELNGEVMHMEKPMQVMHYQINMAAMIQLGNWFDYLKEQGVYDNTRIIIVADHGYFGKQFDDLIIGKKDRDDIALFNPLLLVKDFNSKGFKTDDQFMTNADVPTLATEGLIDHPKNPFTGKDITNDAKYQGKQMVTNSSTWNVTKNHGNTFLPSTWYAVEKNVFDKNNWKLIKQKD